MVTLALLTENFPPECQNYAMSCLIIAITVMLMDGGFRKLVAFSYLFTHLNIDGEKSR